MKIDDHEIVRMAKRDGKNPMTCLTGICVNRTQIDPNSIKGRMQVRLLCNVWVQRFGYPTFDKIEQWIEEVPV